MMGASAEVRRRADGDSSARPIATRGTGALRSQGPAGTQRRCCEGARCYAGKRKATRWSASSGYRPDTRIQKSSRRRGPAPHSNSRRSLTKPPIAAELLALAPNRSEVERPATFERAWRARRTKRRCLPLRRRIPRHSDVSSINPVVQVLSKKCATRERNQTWPSRPLHAAAASDTHASAAVSTRSRRGPSDTMVQPA